jgi:hypothetical protein
MRPPLSVVPGSHLLARPGSSPPEIEHVDDGALLALVIGRALERVALCWTGAAASKPCFERVAHTSPLMRAAPLPRRWSWAVGRWSPSGGRSG